MKPSPILLTDYFLTELMFSASPQFNPKKEAPISFEDFQITFVATCNPEDKRDWNISLKLKYQPAAEANTPYRFVTEIVGYFKVHDEFSEASIERLVKTNGPSILFGVLREVIRDTTARGPYSPVLLPSVSFYEPEGQQVVETSPS